VEARPEPPLDAGRWERLSALFLAAMELASSERPAFVERETVDDPLLAPVLLGMLAEGTSAPARLETIVGDAVSGLRPADAWTDRRFGPYRVVREIGRGGMGLVFEAVRDDDAYHKRVALKIVPWWRDTPGRRDRFRQERQILAELEHPHIARLLDGGTEGDIPYFVMEYVEGRPITAYCDERGLDLRQRLALFCLVCDAVRAAHERLIVHRDLKPANVLVGRNGAPKLLDFGIAKLLDPVADTGATVGEPAWTPDYASPEQVRNQSVTTRTDVYSLGLVLYELITGARAQVADRSSPLALDRSVCEVEPPVPSARSLAAGERVRARQLRGDLDTIVMTAIRKEPARRYGSAAAMAEDIRRHLDALPIQARPGSTGYRAARFMRRHAMGVAAAALVVAVAAAGGVATFYQARRAERRFEQVRALANAFVFDVHDRIAPLAGATEARRAIVSTALTYLENLRADAGDDAALARELAAAYEKVGTVQGGPISANLGDTDGAMESYARAVGLLEPLAAVGDRAATRQLSEVVRQRAFVHQSRGDTAAMAAGFERAIDLARTVVAQEPNDREALYALSDAASSLARAAFQSRDLAVAERAGVQAMEASERLVSMAPADDEYRDQLATAHNALGATRLMSGRLAEAADAFKASIAIRERLAQEQPDNATRRRSLMISSANLGDLLGYREDNLGDRAGALAAFRRVFEIAERARLADPSDQRALYDVASARLRLGSVLRQDTATAAEGVRQLQEADRILRPLLASDPASDRNGYLAILVRIELGRALDAAGRSQDAAAMLASVRSDGPRLLTGPNGPSLRRSLVSTAIALAGIYARTGDPRAGALLGESTSALAALPETGTTARARWHADLGRAYLAWGRSRTGARTHGVRRPARTSSRRPPTGRARTCRPPWSSSAPRRWRPWSRRSLD
jgi:tetratricopeptide (TPR) repeat protein